MGESSKDEVQQLIDTLADLRGEGVLVRLREIIELGKRREEGDVVAAFAKHLIEAGSALGRLDYEMIGFGELQALYLRDARYADLRSEVLWYFKWLTERLAEYVEVPAEQIWSTFDRMEQFYRAENEGLRPVHGVRCKAAAIMGLNDEAQRHFELWEATEKHASDDCPACETHLKVQILLDQGRIGEAIEAAGPIIEGGQRCDEVPVTTFSRLLVPLLFQGNPDQAAWMCLGVGRVVRAVPKFVGYIADHVLFLTLAGLGPRASRLTFLMLAKLHETSNTAAQFNCWRAAWVHYAILKKVGVGELKFPVPDDADSAAPARRPGRARWCSKLLSVDDAIALAERKTRQIAAAFDARNGTDRFATRVRFAERIANAETSESEPEDGGAEGGMNR